MRLELDGDAAGAARTALVAARENPGTFTSVRAFAVFMRLERSVDLLLEGSRQVARGLPDSPITPRVLGEVAQVFELAGFEEEAASFAEEAWKRGGAPEMLLRSLRIRLEMGDAASVLTSIQSVGDTPGLASGLRPILATANIAAGRLAEARVVFEDVLILDPDPSDRLAAAWGLYELARVGGNGAEAEKASNRLRELFPASPEASLAQRSTVQGEAASPPSRLVEEPSPALLLTGSATASAGTGAVPQPPAAQLFSVQVGSFKVQENATEWAAELERKGYSASIKEASAPEGRLWRVFAGVGLAADMAADLLARLKKDGYSGIVAPER